MVRPKTFNMFSSQFGSNVTSRSCIHNVFSPYAVDTAPNPRCVGVAETVSYDQLRLFDAIWQDHPDNCHIRVCLSH